MLGRSSCVLLALGLPLGSADDRPEYGRTIPISNTTLGYYVGDQCTTGCSEILLNTFCNRTSRRCECDRDHPIVVDHLMCVPPAKLGDECHYSESCAFLDPHSRCKPVEAGNPYAECTCRPGFHALESQKDHRILSCQQDMLSPIMKAVQDPPTVVALSVLLVTLLAVLCMLFRFCARSPRLVLCLASPCCCSHCLHQSQVKGRGVQPSRSTFQNGGASGCPHVPIPMPSFHHHSPTMEEGGEADLASTPIAVALPLAREERRGRGSFHRHRRLSASDDYESVQCIDERGYACPSRCSTVV